MLAPVVGNFFSSLFEFLYEQCSLHITEKMPSSVKFGSRPRIFLMRSNSSGVRPCCLTSSGVTTGSIVGFWLVIDAITLTDVACVSIDQFLQEKVNIDTVLQVQGKRKHQQKETNNEENNPWIRLCANRPICLCADKHDPARDVHDDNDDVFRWHRDYLRAGESDRGQKS